MPINTDMKYLHMDGNLSITKKVAQSWNLLATNIILELYNMYMFEFDLNQTRI